MANVKNKFKSRRYSSRKKFTKIDYLNTLLIGFDNDKITELVMSNEKTAQKDASEPPIDPALIKDKEQDTVLVKDSVLKREIKVPRHRLLTKHGHLKCKTKDNLRLCNDILKNELLISDNKKKQLPQNNINNNIPVTSDQNKSKAEKEIQDNDKDKKRGLKESEKSDQNTSLSPTKRKSDNGSKKKHKKSKKRKNEIICSSDDLGDIPPLKKIRNRRSKGLYICDYCNKEFHTRCNIRRHIYIHLANKTYPCGHCKKVFRKTLYLQAHITRQHPNWEQHYMCNLCDKPFLLKENLIVHMATHNYSETKFKCLYCREKFTQQNKLVQHEQKQHLVDGRYGCVVCDQSFDTRNKLSLHFKTHLKVKEYVCQHCGKEFLRMNSMKRHVAISHAGIRIQCPICKKVLKGHLSEHMRTHEKKRPHKCPDCGQCFTQSTQLTVHRRSHSGARPYPCRICKRPFTHSNALMLHIRRHTGEKPFECAMCPLAFSQLPHMKAHMRNIHGKEKPYRCKKCKHFFKLKSELSEHAKKCQHGQKESSVQEKTQTLAEFEEEQENVDSMSLSRMRYLLALLLTMIATKEKLKYLGFNKRLIDDLLVESLEAMGHVPCKNKSLAPIKRLKTNIAILLNGTVPKEKMEKFRKESKSTEDILELLTDEKK